MIRGDCALTYNVTAFANLAICIARAMWKIFSLHCFIIRFQELTTSWYLRVTFHINVTKLFLWYFYPSYIHICIYFREFAASFCIDNIIVYGTYTVDSHSAWRSPTRSRGTVPPPSTVIKRYSLLLVKTICHVSPFNRCIVLPNMVVVISLSVNWHSHQRPVRRPPSAARLSVHPAICSLYAQ